VTILAMHATSKAERRGQESSQTRLPICRVPALDSSEQSALREGSSTALLGRFAPCISPQAIS
jgi:hypothetical protein